MFNENTGPRRSGVMDSDEDDKGLSKLQVNKEFAEEFNTKQRNAAVSRKAGLIQKLSKATIEADSDSEEEDDDGDLLDPALDIQIHKTLHALRKRDPKIYDNSARFFANPVEKPRKRKHESSKQSVRSVIATQLLNGDDESDSADETDRKSKPLPYFQQQEKLKEEFAAALQDQGLSSEDEDGDASLFTVRRGSSVKDAEDDGDMLISKKEKRKIIQSLLSTEDDSSQGIENKKKNEFLRSYFANEWWKEKDTSKLPTYEEIVGEERPQMPDISEDEDELDAQDVFEAQYNFRFEEDGANEIMTFPRDIEDSVRKKSEARKKRREAQKKRKEEEKKVKMEELKRLKNVKKQEIVDKLAQLEATASGVELGFEPEELEQDFDPEKYDAEMATRFGDAFYNQEEDDDEAIRNMLEQEEELKGVAKMKPGKFHQEHLKKAKKAMAKSRQKVETTEGWNIQTDTQVEQLKRDLDQKVDEYYKLDCEDIIGDLRCRFNYTDVAPADYGLTLEEILTLSDKELNQRISIKKLAPYREDQASNTAWWERNHSVPGVGRKRGNGKPVRGHDRGAASAPSSSIPAGLAASWRNSRHTKQTFANTRTPPNVSGQNKRRKQRRVAPEPTQSSLSSSK
eukprot:g52360.t1